MGAGGGVALLADAQDIIKNVVNLPTNEEPLDNIKRSHITAKTLLPDTHPVGDWLRRVYIITLENYGIIKDLAPTRPGGEPITGILLLLKFSTVLATFRSALSTHTAEGFPVLSDPSFLFTEVSNFKQWRPELSERFRLANSIPVFIHLHISCAPMGQVQGHPTQVSGGDSIISNITDLRSLQSRMYGIESHQRGSNPQGGEVGGGGGAGRGGASRVSTRMDNPSFGSALLQCFKDMVSATCKSIHWSIKTHAISEALTMSKGDATKSMCLTWHSKGTCNSNCPLSHGHVSYDPTKFVQFKDWRDQHFKPE